MYYILGRLYELDGNQIYRTKFGKNTNPLISMQEIKEDFDEYNYNENENQNHFSSSRVNADYRPLRQKNNSASSDPLFVIRKGSIEESP